MTKQSQPRTPEPSDLPHASDELSATEAGVSRRMMLRGTAVGTLALPLLAACGGGAAGGTDEPKKTDSVRTGSGAVPKSAVPVGGGLILSDQNAVLTQPTKGEFKAFSAKCTHKGCPVKEISDGEIICPCHDSHFSITDGSAVKGPATAPLVAKKVSVEGDRLTVG